jgi:peptidoglycan/xylan/chitin deacetylase (PgdA/CDA1 family)
MKAAILMYHRISKIAGDDSAVLPQEFDRQMAALAKLNYEVISLLDLIAHIVAGKTLPSRTVVLTFDDGFDETCEEASIILKKYRYPATFFLISNLIGHWADWLASRHSLVNWDGARSLVREGFAVGSHALTHRRLNQMSVQVAREEITRSKRILEDGLGVAVQSFAYPFGCWNMELRDIVSQSGYDAACTTECGFNGDKSEIFALRRIDINGKYSLSMFERSLTFGENQMSFARELLYYSRRLLGRIPFASAS